MGRHVDTTSPVDHSRVRIRDYAEHRKPGPPSAPLGHRTFLDPWSGNPDTDRAWRDRLPGMDHLSWW